MSSFHSNHPFISFILSFLLSISMIAGFILVIFVILKLVTKIFDNIKFAQLKKTVERNPYIGRKDTANDFIYRQGAFSLQYRIFPGANQAKNRIKLIYSKRRMLFYEKALHKLSKSINSFLLYRQWTYLLKPKIFLTLLLLIIFFYIVGFEPQQHKKKRLIMIVSALLRVNPEDVEVYPGGWVEISGRRKTVNYQFEPISINVNLFKWLTFQENACYITRWKGKENGYVNYPLQYDDYGNIQIKKEGKWITGTFGATAEDTLSWEKPQGTGVRAGKVKGHKLDLNGKALLSDK